MAYPKGMLGESQAGGVRCCAVCREEEAEAEEEEEEEDGELGAKEVEVEVEDGYTRGRNPEEVLWPRAVNDDDIEDKRGEKEEGYVCCV